MGLRKGLICAAMFAVLLGAGTVYADGDTGGEFRWQFWHDSGNDYTDTTDDSADFNWVRARVHHDWTANEELSGRAEFQATQMFGATAVGGDGDTINLKQAYFQWKCSQSQWVLTGGRERRHYGDGRLIGSGDWTMAGQSFDGVRFSHAGEADIDVFAYTVAEESTPGPARPAKTTAENTLFGVYGTQGPLQVYLIKRDTKATPGAANQSDFYTVGGRFDGAAGGLHVNAEGAWQGAGDNGGADHSAWAIHGGADLMVGPISVMGAIDLATGQGSSTDSEAFQTLYEDNHNLFGYQDLFTWTNLRHVSAGASIQLRDTCKLIGSIHTYTLAEKPAGGKDDAGSEIDIVLEHTISENAKILFVASRYFVGDVNPGSGATITSGDDRDLFVIDLSISF